MRNISIITPAICSITLGNSLISFRGNRKYFDNDLTEKYFRRLISMNSGSTPRPDSITELRGYLMSMKKVFWPVSKNIFLPYETIIFLLNWFFQFVDTINIKLHELKKEEKTRERNSQNASTWTPAKIEEYKKHDLYPQLEEMIRSCQENTKGNTQFK